MIIIVLSCISILISIIRKAIHLRKLNTVSSRIYFDNKRIFHVLTVAFCELLYMILAEKNVWFFYITVSLIILMLFILFSHSVYNKESNVLITYLGKKHKVQNIIFHDADKTAEFITDTDSIKMKILSKRFYSDFAFKLK